MPPRPLPTRQLPEHPDLDQLRRQAKELLHAFRDGQPEAAAEVHAHYRHPERSTFALHDAQLVVARAYGFESWPKLKAYADGITVRRLRDAIVADNLPEVRDILAARPELARASLDNLGLLHHAVFNRSTGIVRLLMRHGASAREGVYPHREATSALTIAAERGYEDVVRIIEEEEAHERRRRSGEAIAPDPDALFTTILSGETDRALAMMDADPALVRTRHAVWGVAPLHVAARRLDAPLVDWLLGHGADPAARDARGYLALDWAAYSCRPECLASFRHISSSLLAHGSPLTAPAAVVLGDAGWLRARHAEGSLTNPIEDAGGLLRIAATHDRADLLALLLEFGMDPDERVRVGFGDPETQTFSWGMPLCHCAGTGKYEMAELLLKHGADPNAAVYASGDPVFSAYSEGDWNMVRLLEQYGGVPTGATAGLFRQTDLARRMLAGEAPHRLERGSTLAEELLWGGACGGDPEIVRMALERVDWARDDPRWFEMLEQPLRLWGHGSVSKRWDRTTYVTCFRLLLERADPDVRGRPNDRGQFGLTILHGIAGSRAHLTPDDRVAFATAALDAGARLHVRDHILQSTPLGWACRWGRLELVRLFLERGADPIEPDAEPWASPEAWAAKKGHAEVLDLLRARRPPPP